MGAYTTMDIRDVGIVGASGYSGIELTRLVLGHGGVRLAFATSDRWEGQQVVDRTGLASHLRYVGVDQGLADAERCQVVFLATPAETSLELVPRLWERGVTVIDLAGSFRLKDLAAYPRYYRFTHPAGELVERAVYGLPELFREDIRSARLLASPGLIANPGCYATAAALSMAPLLEAELVDPSSVVITAASGVSGAGRKASEEYTFMELDGDFRPYRTLTHQHLPEIAQTLTRVAGTAVQPVFIPHLLPVKRGIICTAVARLARPVSPEELAAAVRARYQAEPLMVVKSGPDQVRLADVVHTPRCTIGVTSDERTLVSVTGLDNLLKGAASQAMQNMNLVLGFPETQGLA